MTTFRTTFRTTFQTKLTFLTFRPKLTFLAKTSNKHGLNPEMSKIHEKCPNSRKCLKFTKSVQIHGNALKCLKTSTRPGPGPIPRCITMDRPTPVHPLPRVPTTECRASAVPLNAVWQAGHCSPGFFRIQWAGLNTKLVKTDTFRRTLFDLSKLTKMPFLTVKESRFSSFCQKWPFWPFLTKMSTFWQNSGFWLKLVVFTVLESSGFP